MKTGGFAVRYTDVAREDLLRLFDFLLARTDTAEGWEAAQRTIDCLAEAIERHLARSPFIFRKAGASAFVREIVISWGHAGYVALYEIEGADTVNILALRHQRDDEFD